MEQNDVAFVFDSYSVSSDKKMIQFSYKYQGFKFVEKIILPEVIPDSVNQELLTKVLENLHLILGISYFKMYCPKNLTIPYSLTKDQSDFWNTVYTKGLGEFFYKNQINFKNLINFPYVDKPSIQPRRLDEAKKNRFLVGIGGGKDSIVAFELLKEQKKNVSGFILDSQETLSQVQIDVAKTMGIEYLLVKRQLDRQLFDLKSTYNGHIPVTAVYSFTALLLSIIYNYSTIIIPNGKSANFGNVNYLGTEINHQWSKSEEFEKLFQDYVNKYITPDINYFSNLRSFSEMEIAKMFSSYEKYFSVFSSCNKNFKIKRDVNQKRWCGQCAKCAFVFIILAANLSKETVTGIFNKNLLNDQELIPMYKDLIGQGSMKPFDCVGTFEESQEAFRMIKSKGEFANDAVIKIV
jgi:hypothetical protein